MIYDTLRYTVRGGTVQGCKEAVRELVEHVKKNEPGTVFYLALQEDRQENKFVHIGAFESHDARTRHRNSEAMRLFRDLIYPVTIDGLGFTEQTVVDRLPTEVADRVL